jgi:hypothetical protein
MRGDADNPLASIDDVKKLGNSGGGNFGDLLVLFATGNHAFMRDDSGKLDRKVPDGLFSLELPGSQGSHPGHSGILQGDPGALGSGRLSNGDFERLAARAKDGFLRWSDAGSFIAENLIRDPKSKVFDKNALKALGIDVGGLLGTIVPALSAKLFGSDKDDVAAHRDFQEKFTKLAGENNLIGSAGEFGLLFTLLASKPGSREVNGEPAVSLADVRAMFLDKRLPAGWESWEKQRTDWVRHTSGILFSAFKEYWRLKR